MVNEFAIVKAISFITHHLPKKEHRSKYVEKPRSRKYSPSKGVPAHTSVYTLYRLYELLVVYDVTGYRITPEYLCKQRTYAVRDVPDLEDRDLSRYVFLA